MNKIIRFGIVGTGHAADTHAKALKMLPSAELVSVFSRNEERLQQFKNRFSIHGYNDFERMLSSDELDAVIIATYHNQHADFGMIAADAGKEVIVEKPIDASLTKARMLVKKCNESNVKLCVISQRRYDDAHQMIKSAFDKNEFGNIFSCSLMQRHSVKPPKENDHLMWYYKGEKTGGGVLMTDLVHFLDCLLWLMGDVEAVYGNVKTVKGSYEIEDFGAGVLHFKNGATGLVEITRSAAQNYFDRLEFHGTKGSIIYEGGMFHHWDVTKEDFESSGQVEFEQETLTMLLKKRLSTMMPYRIFTYKKLRYGTITQQMNDVINAILKDVEMPVPGEDGVRVLEVLKAFYLSNKLKKVVELPLIGDEF